MIQWIYSYVFLFDFYSVHIFDDMLAGIGWNLRDYLQYSQNDQYLSHENGHRLFLHDIRRVAIRAAIAMGKKGDMIVSSS